MAILQLLGPCRALRAPIIFSSLTCKKGRCAPPALLITASLILPAKLKIQYVEKLREKSQFGKEGESVVKLSYCHIVQQSNSRWHCELQVS
jgi:hypothetical protein